MEGELNNGVENILKSLSESEKIDEKTMADVYRSVNDQMQKDAADYRERESQSELSAASISVSS